MFQYVFEQKRRSYNSFDNCIIYSKPHFDENGQPQIMTDTKFEVFSVSSKRGQECIQKYCDVWNSAVALFRRFYKCRKISYLLESVSVTVMLLTSIEYTLYKLHAEYDISYYSNQYWFYIKGLYDQVYILRGSLIFKAFP